MAERVCLSEGGERGGGNPRQRTFCAEGRQLYHQRKEKRNSAEILTVSLLLQDGRRNEGVNSLQWNFGVGIPSGQTEGKCRKQNDGQAAEWNRKSSLRTPFLWKGEWRNIIYWIIWICAIIYIGFSVYASNDKGYGIWLKGFEKRRGF